MSGLFGSLSMAARALDAQRYGLDVAGQNIANVNTPNYHAKRVSFEDALAASVQSGNGRVQATTAESLEPTQLNGNNVNLDTETVTDEKTALQYSLLSGAISAKFNLIDTVLKG